MTFVSFVLLFVLEFRLCSLLVVLIYFDRCMLLLFGYVSRFLLLLISCLMMMLFHLMVRLSIGMLGLVGMVLLLLLY